MTTVAPSEISRKLDEEGWAGPVPVLSADECRRFVGVLSQHRQKSPLDWSKGYGAASRAYYELATHPAILALVEEALGGNVMLWGASTLQQKPGSIHPWHSDMETSKPGAKTVSVWLGIENISIDSALYFVSKSHAFGVTIQEVRKQLGKARSEATTENVVEWAKQRDPSAKLIKPDIRIGEALLFQGQAWHHSDNQTQATRRSVLLQYARSDSPIRIPDPNNFEWPFVDREFPRPPCVMLRGSDTSGVNRFVSAPYPTPRGIMAKLTNQIYPIPVPLAPDNAKGFKPYQMFTGSTPDLREMDVHVSVLNKDQCPHPPHQHREEEILIMLSGEADLLLPQVKGPHGDERYPIKPGDMVYYPAMFPHTLRTTSAEPANYLMFKWLGEHGKFPSPLGFKHLSLAKQGEDPLVKDGYRMRVLFEGATQCLRKLHCHLTTLDPGAGYEPHADAYDVAILVLEGEVTTLGQVVKPFGTIFHAAGELHGIRNTGNVPARYVVFEFHGSQMSRDEAFPASGATLMQKLTDPKRWKGKIKRVLKKVRGK